MDNMFRPTSSGVRRGTEDKPVFAAGIEPPAWKRHLTNSTLVETHKAQIADENRRAAQDQRQGQSTQKASPWKSGIGTVKRKLDDGTEEEYDANDLLDDPEVGPIAEESLFKRDVVATKADVAKRSLLLQDPSRPKSLSDREREDILLESKGLRETDPRHIELKKKLMDDEAGKADYASQEQAIFDGKKRLLELGQGGIAAWRERRKPAPTLQGAVATHEAVKSREVEFQQRATELAAQEAELAKPVKGADLAATAPLRAEVALKREQLTADRAAHVQEREQSGSAVAAQARREADAMDGKQSGEATIRQNLATQGGVELTGVQRGMAETMKTGLNNGSGGDADTRLNRIIATEGGRENARKFIQSQIAALGSATGSVKEGVGKGESKAEIERLQGALAALTKQDEVFAKNGITDPAEQDRILADAAKESQWTENDTDKVRTLSTGELAINPGMVFGDREAVVSQIQGSSASEAEKALAVRKLDAMRVSMAEKLENDLYYGDTRMFGIGEFRDFVSEKEAQGQAGDKVALLDEWSKKQKDRSGVFKLNDALWAGVAKGEIGIAKTVVGTVAGVAGAMGADSAQGLGKTQEMLGDAIQSGGEAEKFRGQTGGYGLTSELMMTVTQMAPMLYGGQVSQGLQGVSRAVVGGMSVYGWAAAQGYESKLGDAVDMAREAKGSDLTGEEIAAVLGDGKTQAAAFLNGAQTAILAKVLGGGAERAALGKAADSMTVRDFIRRGGAQALRDGVLKKELKAMGKTILKDAGDEFVEESLNQLLDGIISSTVLDKEMQFGDLLVESFKAGGMGALVGGGLPQVRKNTGKPTAPAPTTPERVNAEILANDPDAVPATPEEVTGARDIVGDDPVDAAEGVIISREIAAVEQEAAQAFADAESQLQEAQASGDKGAVTVAEGNLVKARGTAAVGARVRGALKIARGEDISTLTDAEARALGIKRKGDNMTMMTAKELEAEGLTKPMLDFGADDTPVILDSVLDEIRAISPAAAARVKLTETEARKAAQGRADVAAMPDQTFTVTGRDGTSVQVKAKTPEQAQTLAMEDATWPLGEQVAGATINEPNTKGKNPTPPVQVPPVSTGTPGTANPSTAGGVAAGAGSAQAQGQGAVVSTERAARIKAFKTGNTQSAFALASIAKSENVDLSTMSREEYVAYAKKQGIKISDQTLRERAGLRMATSMAEMLQMRKDIRPQTAEDIKADKDFAAFAESIKKLAEGKGSLHNGEVAAGVAVRSGTKDSNSWLFFGIGKGAGTDSNGYTHKSYIGFKNHYQSLTPSRLIEFMSALKAAGFNGDVKSMQDLASQRALADQVVMHGNTKADADLAIQVAESFFGEELSFRDVGTDSKTGGSHSQILANTLSSELDAELSSSSQTTNNSQPASPPAADDGSKPTKPAAPTETLEKTLFRRVTKLKKNPKLAAALKISEDPADRAKATDDGKIVVNLKALIAEAAQNGLTGKAAETWISGVIDEEIRHLAQHEAARATWEAAGSPDSFKVWRSAHYRGIWIQEFVAKGLADDVRDLYGPEAFDALVNWQKAYEGLRMVSQKLATGNPTEVSKLLIGRNSAFIAHLRAALKALKDFVAGIEASPALAAEITAIEAALATFTNEQSTANSRNRPQKPSTVQTPDGDVRSPEKERDRETSVDGAVEPPRRDPDVSAPEGTLIGRRVSWTRNGESLSGVVDLELLEEGMVRVVLAGNDAKGMGTAIAKVADLEIAQDTKAPDAPANPATEGNNSDTAADKAIAEIRNTGVTYLGDARFAILQGDDSMYYVLKTINGKQQPVTSWYGEIEGAQKDAIRQIKAMDAPQAEAPADIVQGMRITKTKVNSESGVKDRWMVQTDENKERVANGEREIGGNTLHESREDAVAFIALERKRQKQETDAAEARAKAEKEAADKQSAIDAPINDYLDTLGLSAMARGKLKTTLSEQTARRHIKSGKTWNGTRHSVMRDMLADGWSVRAHEINAIKEPSRTQWNRMDNSEQAAFEKKKKAAGKKTEYLLESGSSQYDITKAEFDYGNWLAAPQAEPTTPVTPKPTLSAAEQALKDAFSDMVDGLDAAPLSPDADFYRSKGIPRDKRATFMDVADKLYDEGVRTPEALAAALEKVGNGKLRAYSAAVWSVLQANYPELGNFEGWADVYAAMESTPVDEPSTTFDATKGKVMQRVSNDVRDLLLGDEDVTVNRVKALRPEYATLSRKELDESIEAGITAAAHKVAKEGLSQEVTYRRLIQIYGNQPSLNAKTSTSKINQAYSTPTPLAYVASLLADIQGGKVIVEPTYGHGILLMETRKGQVVQSNEIDPSRRQRTLLALPESATWQTTGEDATSWQPEQTPDRVISNPPFGSLMAEDGSNIAWITVAGKTTAIDHAIMLKQLAAMAPDGRAVFIIGGPAKTARSESSRKDHYGRGSKGVFFKYLHDNYGVVDHFTVDGDLYAKQGAGWNVDVIVIQGKAPSRTALPSAKAPRMISTWAELFKTTQLTDEQRIQLNRISEEEMRNSVRGMVDALAGIGNMGGQDTPGIRNDSSRGENGEGGTGNNSIPSQSPETEPNGNRDGGEVDGSRDGSPASEPTGMDAGTESSGESSGTRGSTERSGDSTRAVGVPVKESGKFQAEYTPFSGEKGLDTLLPRNMVSPVTEAFARIKRDLGGNLTKFVHEKLGYPAGTDITKYLAGEQIDAVAAAIWNFERGGALIVGDQTGIGKGRIAAALMKYAVNQGYIPVFMTKDPGLHDAMLTEDIPDIASPEIIPAVMDTKLQFDAAKKRKLNHGEEYFAEAASSGSLPGDSNAIFVTYSQITADDAKGLSKADRASARNAGEAPPDKWRMRALRQLAPNAVFILDESHLASGQSTTGWRVADILRRSPRVYYSSATSVKRPENMGIYFKTNVGMLTNGNMAELTDLMNAGGVPAMQVVSSMLAQDGQYLRRERSFDGVKFITQISEETEQRDRELADGLTGSLRQIVTVQDAMRQAADAINAVIAATGKRMGVPAANRAKLETVNFSSKLHNIVGQYLLAIKTQSAADTAIREIRAGKKVVVAVQSTMESAIDGLEFGGFEMSYKGLVLRYLDQMRFLTSGNKAFGRGEVETFEITEKGPAEYENISSKELQARIVTTSTDTATGDTVVLVNEKVAAELMRRAMWDVFERSRNAIAATDLGDLPISPIDAMRQAVERAGIRTGEITGRKRGIDPEGEIYVRPSADTSKPARRVAQAAFNNEDLDFLVINQSGSTGISLHASEKAKVQSTRVMIVAQPNLDINEFMQTLGRIHRSGQVKNPEFILLQTALPAEKRPAAILGKKMSMLNANTTSNAKTDVSEGNTAIDIFNQYGDEMAYKVLERDQDIQDQLRPLGSSLDKFFNKETGRLIPYQEAQAAVAEQPDGYIARTLTGYLAILPVEEQEIFWEKTLADYQAFVSYLDQIGQNALEAKALDLQAKTLSSEVFTEKAEGDSAFSAPSYIETVETKVGKAPLTGEKAVELSAKAKAGSKQALQDYLATADAAATELADKKAKRALKAWDADKRSEFLANQRAQRNVIASAISLVGRFGNVKRNDGNSGLGVIEEIKLDAANPLTPSKQVAVIRVNDSRETLRVPVTQLNEAFTPAPNESASEWTESTDIGGESAIATGNLMAAMKALGGAGKVITYTTDTGEDRMGILLPKSFMTKRAAIKSRVSVDSVEKLVSILDSGIPVTNSDGSIKWTKGADIATLSVPASRSKGGDIWRNPGLNRMALGGEFTQVGNEMRATYRMKDVPMVFKFLTDSGETFSSNAPDSLQAAPLSGQVPRSPGGFSDGQRGVGGQRSSNEDQANRIVSGAEGARSGQREGESRSGKDIARQIFGGKKSGGSKYLAEGSESVVERVGQDWVIKTVGEKGIYTYTADGKLTRSKRFEDIELKSRVINALGGFETHAIEIEGQGYLIQKHGNGPVTKEEAENLRLPFGIRANEVNRLEIDGEEYIVADLHYANFRKDETGKARVIDLIVGKVRKQARLLDEVDDSLLAAPLSGQQARIDKLMDIVGTPDPEILEEVATQQRVFKSLGKKVVGRPDLANPGRTEEDRALWDQMDEARKWHSTRETVGQWVAVANARNTPENDADLIEKVLKNAATADKAAEMDKADPAPAMTPEDTIHFRLMMERRTREAGGDKKKLAENAVLRNAYRSVRASIARSLASGRDIHQTPEQRNRETLINLMTELPVKEINQINARRWSSPQARDKAVEEAVAKRLAEFERQMKKMGITLEEITNKEVFMSLSQNTVLKNITKNLATAEKMAVQMMQKGAGFDAIRRRTGLPEAKIEAIRAQVEQELRAKLYAKAKAGLTLEDLRDQMKGDSLSAADLNAATPLTEAQIQAELDRIIGIGFGIPKVIQKEAAFKPRKVKEAPDDENDPNAAAKRVAKRFIDRLATSQSDTLSWTTKAKMSELEALIREHLKQPVAGFMEKAVALGATEEQARVLNGEAATERARKEMIAQWRKENPKARKPRAPKKPHEIDWNRPEFSDGLASYEFDATGRSAVMQKVIALRDIVGAAGRVESLTGEKKAKAQVLLDQIEVMLKSKGTSIMEVVKQDTAIENYRFDIGDTHHVAMLARTIQAMNTDLIDKAQEYAFASMLSGLQTNLVNLSGGIVNSTWQLTVDRAFESLVNMFEKDPANATFGEMKYMVRAMGPMLSRAWSNAVATWGSETSMFEEDVLNRPPDLAKMAEGTTGYRSASIGGTKGRVIRIPLRALLAADNFVSTARACAEVGAMAYRTARIGKLVPGTPEFDAFVKKEVNIPGSPSWQLAAQKAYEGNFNNALPGQKDAMGNDVEVNTGLDLLGFGINKISSALNPKETDKTAAKLLKTLTKLLFFPFVRVPYNIMKQGIERSINPISLAEIGTLLASNLRYRNGQWTLNADGQKARIIESLGKQLQGTAVMLLMLALGEGDDDDLEKKLLFTGSRPYKDTKKGERELGYRTGLGPYEVSYLGKDGKRYGFSYGRIEPFATVIGGTVDMLKNVKNVSKGRATKTEALGNVLNSFVGQVNEKTMLRGASDLMAILSNEKPMDRYTADRISIIMPNLVKQMVRESDPYFRETPSEFQDMVLYGIWPAGMDRPIRTDLYGDPQKKDGATAAQRIVDFTDAGVTGAVKDSDRMLYNWIRQNPENKEVPIPQGPDKNWTDPLTKQRQPMTAGQRAKFGEIAGIRLKAMVKNLSFDADKPSEFDMKRFQQAIDKSRDDARKILFRNPTWRALK